MGLGAKIKNFFSNLFDKAKAIIKRAFNLAKPFVKEFLSEAAAYLWEHGQELLMEAVEYVEAQGLPTTEAKQKAFKDYMQQRSEFKIDEIKANDFLAVETMALAAWKKARAVQ